MKNASGNALFLILIAVALFAALSYAVTQSGRGSSSIDREQGEIEAARLLSVISEYQQQILRLELVGGYEQVIFNDSAPDPDGTCHIGGIARTPCRTIGLFSPEGGGQLPPVKSNILPENPTANAWGVWYIYGARLVANGENVGSSLPDEYLYIGPIEDETCKALNRRLTGSSDYVTSTRMSGSGEGFFTTGYFRGPSAPEGEFNPVAANPTGDGWEKSHPSGCVFSSSNNSNFLNYIIKER